MEQTTFYKAGHHKSLMNNDTMDFFMRPQQSTRTIFSNEFQNQLHYLIATCHFPTFLVHQIHKYA